MKRSRHVATLALGGACLLALTACDDKPKPPDSIYGSVEECVADGKDEAVCRQSFADAQKAHQAAAPHHKNQASCEEVYGVGKCVPAQSGGGWFMPALAGFMMGKMMGGGSQMAAATPVYRDRYGYSYTGGRPLPDIAPKREEQRTGGYSGSGTGWSGGKAAASPTVQRGGFGSTGRSLSSSSSS
ncbi:MAG: DUF1190 domain-containing protein [Magnetospirillum sp. WYHS-4]